MIDSVLEVGNVSRQAQIFRFDAIQGRTNVLQILEKEDPINAYLKRVLQLFDNDLLGECVFQY